MGIQINTQPQTFKSASTVIGAVAGLSAVSGLTVYGDISASGIIYNTHTGTTINCTGLTATYPINGYITNDATNYLVFLDGVHQIPNTDYTIAGGNITFIPSPVSGVVAHVRTW